MSCVCVCEYFVINISGAHLYTTNFEYVCSSTPSKVFYSFLVPLQPSLELEIVFNKIRARVGSSLYGQLTIEK